MQFLYSFFIHLLLPFLLLRNTLRSRKNTSLSQHGETERIQERLTLYSSLADTNSFRQRPLWLHTVSVGEFIATIPLIEYILKHRPHTELLLTCTTLTGSQRILSTLAKLNANIRHVFLPWDSPFLMGRFYQFFNPCAGLILETEIWPNLLKQANNKNIPIYLLNARMSQKSCNGYLRFKNFSQHVLNRFNKVCAQNEQDGERFLRLGLKKEKLQIINSIKYDIDIDYQSLAQSELQRKKLAWLDKFIILAASTHQGEDEIFLEVFANLRKTFPNMVLIIVPRHPERFEKVYKLACTVNKNYTVQKRSQLHEKQADILIGDSMGEMLNYYQLSDVVLMGGSFINRGGHNLLEPAALAKSIILGPYMFNFEQISHLFVDNQAVIQISLTDDFSLSLYEQLCLCYQNPEKLTTLGENAKKLLEKNSGARQDILELLIEEELLGECNYSAPDNE